MLTPDKRGGYAFERDIPEQAISQLLRVHPIKELKLTRCPLVTVKLAKRLAGLQVERLWFWCDVTRRAMRHIIQTPGLRVLDVLAIRGPGHLANFGKAEYLEELRANHYMTEHDLLQVAQCAQLRELGAQHADLSSSAMDAILSLPHLTTLDVESTQFDDRMARRTSRSMTITSLDLGATRLTRAGLEHLVSMEQQRSLDLWALDLTETDLRLVLDLPNLEYISLGGYDHLP